jgi:RNA polymerase-binding protein DksA
MSPIDTERFRTALLEQRGQLVHEIDYLHQENPGSMMEESEEMPLDNHLAETASVTLDREIDYTLEENAEHILAAVDEALARIEQGTFGVCQRCRAQIAEERLEAIPYATLCIDCKRKDARG